MANESKRGVAKNVKVLSNENGGYLPVASNEDAMDPSATAEEPSPSLSLYHLTCLIGYSLSFIIFGSQVSILGPTIKPLAEKLGVEETALAPLFTALGISCIISGPPSGWVVDRYPTHYVLIASLLVEAVGFSLVPLMPSVWSLTLLYFVTCFSYNFTNSAVFTSLGWMFPKKAGGSLNLVLAMFGVGSFFIPLAAEACKQFLGSALDVFWLVGGLSMVSTIPFLFVESPQKPELITEDPQSGQPSPSKLKSPQDLHAASNEDEDMDIEAAIAAEELQMNVWFLETLTSASVIFLVFCTTAAETAIGNWLYTYASNEMGLEDAQAALVNSAFWGAFTAGRVYCAPRPPSFSLSHSLSLHASMTHDALAAPSISSPPYLTIYSILT
jgi:FHS family Na+ dependent glucose MFS transporter 1